jgi:transcriptional regulator with XRE-family HTH domain
MGKNEVDLVNLQLGQVRPSERIEVPLPHVQEDHRMLKPDVVDRIREWAAQGVGVKQIARRLGIARNSVRRYLTGARVGFQDRPAARRLDQANQLEVERLFGGVAEGNTVVVQQELAARGIEVELRTLQRAVAPLPQLARARALATVRFETKPGQ